MIKISHFIPAVSLIMALSLHCGETVDEIQSFRPNQGPVILEFTHDLPDGTPITASTAITLYARATDPEGRPMRFEFLSEDGSFSNQVNGSNESTVVFHSAGYLVSAQEVKATVRVYDSKRFTDSMEILLGVTIAGPSVKIQGEFCPYVRPDGMTEFSFTANASGLCQYYVRQDEDPTAQFDPSEPCFYYSKGEVKTITVGGQGCVFSEVNLFDEAQTPDRLYIILTDSLGQEGVNSVMFYVDGVSPESSASPEGGRFPSALPVTITGSDNSSGCAAISYTLNGTDPDFSGNGTVVTGSKAQFAVGSTKGIYELRYRAKDRAGNIENIKSALFEIGVADIGMYRGETPLPSETGVYDFSVTRLNTSSEPVTITVKNEGSLSLTLYDVISSDNLRFTVNDTLMNYTLDPGESTSFAVTYNPDELAFQSATITLSSDDVDEGNYTFTVEGEGGDSDIVVSQDGTDITSGSGTYSFPGYTRVGQKSDDKVFIITNNGQFDLFINAVESDDLHFHIDTSEMSTTLTPGEFTTCTIAFTPSTPMFHSANITILSSDITNNPYTFMVNGYGSDGNIEVSQGGFSIGNGGNLYTYPDYVMVGSDGTTNFTITNSGDSNLQIMSVTPADNVQFSIDPAPAASLPPGNTTNFGVKFSPAAAGRYTTSITIASDDPEEETYTFTLHVDGEWYDTWTYVASMPAGQSDHAAAAVNDRIYTMGGSGPSNLVQEYDPKTNTWSTKKNMPTARYALAAAAYDGYIYAMGGVPYDHTPIVERYDPSSDSWIGRASMGTKRSYHGAAVLDGYIYAIGGLSSNSGGTAPAIITSVEKYDPTLNSWTYVANIPVYRIYVAASELGGRVYAIGGYHYEGFFNEVNYNTIEQYTPDSWTTMGATMSTGRSRFSAAMVNGRIYAIGGYNGGALSSVEEFDGSSWTYVMSMPTVLSNHAAAVVNGKIFVVGGGNKTMKYMPPLH